MNLALAGSAARSKPAAFVAAAGWPAVAAVGIAGLTAGFFLWAWAVKIKQERKLAGTLPAWQDMPITWLAIAGLVCTIAGFFVLFFTQNQGYGGLFAP